MKLQKDETCRRCAEKQGADKTCATYRSEHCSFDRKLSTPKGKWIQVEQRVRLNTPNMSDGFYSLHLDGKLFSKSTDIKYRTQSNLTIDGIFFSSFFGGNSIEWAPQGNVSTYYDEFAIFAPKK
eukprot:Awhi_evm3s15230